MITQLISIFTRPVWWVLNWVPRIGRLHCYQGGVKVTGRTVKVLGTWYWFIPNVSEVFQDNVVRKARALDKQTLTTKDDVTVRVGGVLVFTVADVVTWLIENEHPDTSLLVEAERAVRRFVEAHTYDELRSDQRDLTPMGQAVLAGPFGVDIERLAMTDFARTTARDFVVSGTPVMVADEPRTEV